MSTNLKLSPYFLDDEAIQWVEDTIANMTIEEKIGQLFVNLGKSTDEALGQKRQVHLGVTGFSGLWQTLY